jgi:hypothetical protein
MKRGPRKRQYVILPAVEDRQAIAPRTREEIAIAVYSKTRRELIAEAAYGRAVERAFRNGDPLQDWLAAEAEVDAKLTSEARRDQQGATPPRDERSHR